MSVSVEQLVEHWSFLLYNPEIVCSSPAASQVLFSFCFFVFLILYKYIYLHMYFRFQLYVMSIWKDSVFQNNSNTPSRRYTRGVSGRNVLAIIIARTIETVLLFRHGSANRSESMALETGTIETA